MSVWAWLAIGVVGYVAAGVAVTWVASKVSGEFRELTWDDPAFLLGALVLSWPLLVPAMVMVGLFTAVGAVASWVIHGRRRPVEHFPPSGPGATFIGRDAIARREGVNG